MRYRTLEWSSGLRKALPHPRPFVQQLFFAFNHYLLSRYSHPSLNQLGPFEGRPQRADLSTISDRFTGGTTFKSHTRHADRTSGSRSRHYTDYSMKRSLNHSLPHQSPGLRLGRLAATVALAAVLSTAEGAEDTNAVPAKAEKPPPLPLHQIEGNGGIFSTLSAYIVNPPRNGEPVGRPAVGFSYVNIGHGQNLEALTLTESPWKRLELGFGYNNYDLGDLPKDILATTGVNLSDQTVGLYNANARLQLLKENEFNEKWIPALTFGTHFKYNNTYNSLNSQLGGALDGAGITDNTGVDFTLYASKLFTFLPRPVLLELGGRATKGVELGLVGFTPDYSFLFEGNLAVFLTDRFILAAEYRQQPNDYTPIAVGGKTLVGKSGDWWTIDAAYVVSKHFTVAAGYGHFGGVLNHQANGVWGITTKFEF